MIEEYDPVYLYGWTNVAVSCNHETYLEMVIWLRDNIENCDRNARWYRTSKMYVQFRKPGDAVLFTLRWL